MTRPDADIDGADRVWALPLCATDKIVLLALASRCNPGGYAVAGNRTLAAQCGLSLRAVQRATARLVKGGYVARWCVAGRTPSWLVVAMAPW